MAERGPFPAAETIPFGRPIKLVDGQWRLAMLADMQGVAGRPAWANRARGDTRPRLPDNFAIGDLVDPVVTDGALLMTFPEKRTIGGFVVMAGHPEYVTIKDGKLANG